MLPVDAPNKRTRSAYLWLAVAGFLLTRVIVWLMALWTLPEGSPPPETGWSEYVPLFCWDSAYYREILVNGYPPGPPIPSVAAFFPLYPLLGRLLAPLLTPEGALIAIANAATLIGVFFLYGWSRRLSDPPTAFWCVMLATTYPPAMFLSAGYTEGLFFMEVALTLWLLERRKCLPAACITGLATATRVTGLALAAVVVVWTWRYYKSASRQRRAARMILIAGLSLSGFLAHQGYLWRLYGRPDALLAVERHWKKDPVSHPVLKTLTLEPVLEKSFRPVKYAFRGQFEKLLNPKTWNPVLGLLILVLAVRGLILPENIPRVLFLLPVAVFLLTYLPDPSGGSYLLSVARYQTAALPCFLLSAQWGPLQRRPFIIGGLLVVGMAFQCLYIRAFSNWQWAG